MLVAKKRITLRQRRLTSSIKPSPLTSRRSLANPPPPPAVRVKFDAWIQAIKSRGKWKLDAITTAIYLIACHVHNRQEKLALSGRASTDSMIVALVLMYQFYITAINRAKLQCQLQNTAARMSLQNQQATSKETKPLPENIQYDASKVSLFLPNIFPRHDVSYVSSLFLSLSSPPLGCRVHLSFLRMCRAGHLLYRHQQSTKAEGGIH